MTRSAGTCGEFSHRERVWRRYDAVLKAREKRWPWANSVVCVQMCCTAQAEVDAFAKSESGRTSPDALGHAGLLTCGGLVRGSATGTQVFGVAPSKPTSGSPGGPSRRHCRRRVVAEAVVERVVLPATVGGRSRLPLGADPDEAGTLGKPL